MMGQGEWFENWFNTKWYHVLYGNRDYSEASAFIESLIAFLNPLKNAVIIDAACGAGRHSIHLSKLGFDVLGFDLSPESIVQAKEFENSTLKFDVADLRSFQSQKKADYVFNLFTSFGYFNSKEENLQVLKCFSKALKPKGRVVIDFFNSDLAIKNLIKFETKEIDGVTFQIEKYIENERIVKKIDFEAEGVMHEYFERVSAFSIDDFNSLLHQTGFTITHTFGDYLLNEFDLNTSPRLVLIAEKKG